MHIRILDRYIFREVFMTFIFGICAFSAVFIGSGTLFRIAQYITEYGASVGSVVKIFFLSLPSVIIWTFPMSMLLGCLLAFGRLSASSEITAMKSCGISYFDSAIEQIPLALHYLGKDPNSENPEDIKAAVDMMKKVRPDIKRFTSSGYIDDMAAGNLCVSVGYGGDLNIAKTRAKEAGNGVEIEVLTPKNGVGIWVDSLMIPRDAQNVANAHKYINHTLNPETAAKNGNYVTYAPASRPARDLMDEKYTSDESIFPSKELMEKSFIVSPKSTDASRLSVRLWQALKAGR